MDTPWAPITQPRGIREGTLTLEVENIVINKLCGTTH